MLFLRGKSKHKKSDVDSMQQNPFYAVEIQAGRKISCIRAREVAGVRFLSAEAPVLSLILCKKREHCSCTYKHYSDRRGHARRDSDIGIPNRMPINNGRQTTGRRATDKR